MSKKTRQKQLEATQSIIKGFRGAAQGGCLKESIKRKERAVKALFDLLQEHVLPLRQCGISAISIAHLGGEIKREIEMQMEMQSLYGNRFTAIAKNGDLYRSYEATSLRIDNEAERVLAPIEEEAQKAIDNPRMVEVLEFIALT